MSTAQPKRRGRSPKTLDMIAQMIEIARVYKPCGVRALAYQLFNRKLLPAMAKKYTQKVSTLSVIAREEGSLPWDWIVDETREEEVDPTWDDPEDYGQACEASYRRNKWIAQPTHVCVWSEKGTVRGTLQPVLDAYAVPFRVMHGFGGATAVWNAAQANLGRKQDTLILYVGDYDPSGMGMSELDLPQRLARYSTRTPKEKDLPPCEVERILRAARLSIRRIALTAADNVHLGPAMRFPASDKRTDARYKWFVRNYGEWCWELDAMSPNDLRARVESAIVAEIDHALWDRFTHVEQLEREMIAETCRTWQSILGQDQI